MNHVGEADRRFIGRALEVLLNPVPSLFCGDAETCSFSFAKSACARPSGTNSFGSLWRWEG